jgi:hypothetical protein
VEAVNVNLESFCQYEKKSDLVFDLLSTRFVNRFLANLEPELCSKSFRTLKANIVFQEELDKKTNCDDDTDAKIQTYVEGNKKVALLLNHRNVVSKVDQKLILKLYSDIKSKEVDKAKEKSKKGNDEGGVRRTVVQRLTA